MKNQKCLLTFLSHSVFPKCQIFFDYHISLKRSNKTVKRKLYLTLLLLYFSIFFIRKLPILVAIFYSWWKKKEVTFVKIVFQTVMSRNNFLLRRIKENKTYKPLPCFWFEFFYFKLYDTYDFWIIFFRFKKSLTFTLVRKETDIKIATVIQISWL